VEVLIMADKIKVALLQNNQSTCTPALQQELRAQSAVVRLAESCKDISAMLTTPDPPDVILTDLTLSDGTWEDVVRIGQDAVVPVNVIVVSRHADTRLYVEVLEKGAFDFIIPPFETLQLSHVLRSAFWNVAKLREERSRASLLRESGKDRPFLAVAS
jgi:two-component system C4-dicarboxylate transport response regulator DctD